MSGWAGMWAGGWTGGVVPEVSPPAELAAIHGSSAAVAEILMLLDDAPQPLRQRWATLVPVSAEVRLLRKRVK